MKRRSFLKALGLIAAAASVNPVELLSQPAPKLDKIALIRKLMEDGINAHDRLIEEAIFSDKKSGSVPTECSFRG